jgi:RNA:NAD 2'-phosphotransferase (TPT1/KptA family)
MQLYHSTTPEAAASIVREGFRGSVVRDREGLVCLSRSKETALSQGRRGCLVVVSVPDEVAHRYQSKLDGGVDDYMDVHDIPVEVINKYRPFVLLSE